VKLPVVVVVVVVVVVDAVVVVVAVGITTAWIEYLAGFGGMCYRVCAQQH
jgi:hypothetical protein